MSAQEQPRVEAAPRDAGGSRLCLRKLSLAFCHLCGGGLVGPHCRDDLCFQLGRLLLCALERLAGLSDAAERAPQRHLERLRGCQLGTDPRDLMIKAGGDVGAEGVARQLALGVGESLQLALEGLNGLCAAQRRHAGSRYSVWID